MLGKFFLYHEIGHTSLTGNVAGKRALIGVAPFRCVLLWVILNVSWSLQSVFIAIFFGALILAINPYVWVEELAKARLYNESAADCFALEHLPDADRNRLSQYEPRRIIPRDKSLDDIDPSFNKLRESIFVDNLRFANEDKWDEIWNQFDPKIPLGIYILLLLTGALGFYSRSASLVLIAINLIVFVGFSFVIALGLLKQQELLDRDIQSCLGSEQANNPLAADS